MRLRDSGSTPAKKRRIAERHCRTAISPIVTLGARPMARNTFIMRSDVLGVWPKVALGQCGSGFFARQLPKAAFRFLMQHRGLYAACLGWRNADSPPHKSTRQKRYHFCGAPWLGERLKRSALCRALTDGFDALTQLAA